MTKRSVYFTEKHQPWSNAVRHTRCQYSINHTIHWTKMNVHKPSNSPWLFFNRHHHNIIKTIAGLYACLPRSPSPLSSMTFFERLHVGTHYLQQYIFENNILSPTRLIPPVIHNKLIHFDFLLSRPCFFCLAPPPWCDSSQRPGYWIKIESDRDISVFGEQL